MDKIIGPKGTQKPPSGVKCWWTAADYEKAYIKEHDLAHISLLKAKIKREGVPKKDFWRAEIKPIRKFGGEFISSYECNIRLRLDLTRKDKLVWLPMKTCSVYKDDSWWIAQISILVQNKIMASKSEQTRRKNKQLRKLYECDGEVTIP